MGTDIYGGIEYRHPGVGSDYYEGEPWITALDLWPLYDRVDYPAFGCLFGVRNDAGFRPLAAGRGLPADVSGRLREQLGPWVTGSETAGASWVSWAELAALDPSSGPEHYRGRLTWWVTPGSRMLHQRFVPADWPGDVLTRLGTPPQGLGDAAGLVEWTAGEYRCRYEPLTAGTVLGEGTGWPQVFAVVKALADRFGDDAVRLVVAFG
ncbi:hypothetical protein [Kitasatospora cathayae]|uniref:DUF1877 family protein n=1 Tax=Kitasatospora cathayae TaxID=3004092 RepID=A0ABY7QF82_9ACTN|nr:hypothetical protein [Kitasatospora sp. HUAS 3-15]WBP91054.1 hypothetical protein O1G21_37755 [Kitasatospora sp. HUAS 3-15]